MAVAGLVVALLALIAAIVIGVWQFIYTQRGTKQLAEQSALSNTLTERMTRIEEARRAEEITPQVDLAYRELPDGPNAAQVLATNRGPGTISDFAMKLVSHPGHPHLVIGPGSDISQAVVSVGETVVGTLTEHDHGDGGELRFTWAGNVGGVVVGGLVTCEVPPLYDVSTQIW